MRFSSKVAIVTGAGRGLGESYARALAAEGARVVVAEIDRSAGEGVARSIVEGGGEAIFVPTDVSSESGASELAAVTVSRYGAIDILVNNAARFHGIALKPIEELSLAEWEEVMAVNLRGLFLTVRAVLPQMKKQGRGKIVNVASNTVFSGGPRMGHYVASKAGVIGFTRCLAKEVGPFGICTNVVAPGLTDTEAAEQTMPAARFEAVTRLRAIPRRQKPADLIGAVLFLASPESDFITGQVLNVDGGQILY